MNFTYHVLAATISIQLAICLFSWSNCILWYF